MAECLTHDFALKKCKTQKAETVSHRNGIKASRQIRRLVPGAARHHHCTCVYLHVRGLVTCFPNHRFCVEDYIPQLIWKARLCEHTR